MLAESQTTLDAVAYSKAFVRDLVDGQQIESPFVVRDRTRREKRNAGKSLNMGQLRTPGTSVAFVSAS